MNTNLTSFFQWLNKFPIWVRAIVLLLISGLALIASMSLTACGSTTRATIRNMADSTSTSVTITTNNPTNWQVTPDVSLTPR